jgi:uncharacterized protein YqcC (DUF446 family)
LRAWQEQDTLALRLLMARRTRDERRLPSRSPSSAMQSILQRARVEPGGAILYDLLLSDPQSSPPSRRLVVLVVRESRDERVEVLRQRDIDRFDREVAGSLPENAAASASAGQANAAPYGEAERVFAAIEQEMRRIGVWEVPRPTDTAIAQGGAFGGASMAFVQWLRWVWAERMNHVLATHSPFPPGSQLAAYAVREFDGQPEYDPLIERLREMDDFVQSQARGHGQ